MELCLTRKKHNCGTDAIEVRQIAIHLLLPSSWGFGRRKEIEICGLYIRSALRI